MPRVFTAIALLTAGCLHTQTIARPPAPAALAGIERATRGHEVTVGYRPTAAGAGAAGGGPAAGAGPGAAAPALPYPPLISVIGQIRLDPVGVEVMDGQKRWTVPLAQVEVIERNDRAAGGIQGLLIGAAMGALSGGLLGYVTGSETCTPGAWTFCLDRPASATFLGTRVAALGGAIGFLLGRASGAGDIWRFD